MTHAYNYLPKFIRERLPELYTTDGQGEEAVAQLKIFDPTGTWTWFATEFDGEDTFFGLVIGHEAELGYFSLKELQGVRADFGLRLERDLHFEPKTLREIRVEYRKRGYIR